MRQDETHKLIRFTWKFVEEGFPVKVRPILGGADQPHPRLADSVDSILSIEVLLFVDDIPLNV